MIDALQQIDHEIFLWLNSLHIDALDQIIYWLSYRFTWIPMYVALGGVMMWRFGWRKGLTLIALVGLTVGLTDYICASVIRPMVERVRPAHADSDIRALVHIVNGYRGGHYGFPSCHAANATALAVCTALIFKQRGFTLFIVGWAVLQCFTRIYLGVHYPGDLLVGATIGGAIAWGAVWMARRYRLLTAADMTSTPARTLVPVYAVAALTLVVIIVST